jgi:hypothetical protein
MKKMSASIKKHIRLEKGRIRREVADLDQQKKMIGELTQKYSNEGNRNLQPGVK